MGLELQFGAIEVNGNPVQHVEQTSDENCVQEPLFAINIATLVRGQCPILRPSLIHKQNGSTMGKIVAS